MNIVHDLKNPVLGSELLVNNQIEEIDQNDGIINVDNLTEDLKNVQVELNGA